MDADEIRKLLELKGGDSQGGLPLEDMKAKINRVASPHVV